MERRLFRSKWLNGWLLFGLFAIFINSFMVAQVVNLDLASPQVISEMIQYSVRWAVPFIFLVTATSALFKLFPNEGSRWLLRNRRYLGLSFATAMAWQGAFIFIVSSAHSEHYYAEIYLLRDELEGSSGYLFLVAMTITSFGFFRRHLTPHQWTFLHRAGIYFLWAYPFSVYWWNVFYYQTQHWWDISFYCLGFTAFALRIVAWGRVTASHTVHWSPLRVLGTGVIIGALILAGSGHLWQPLVSAALLRSAWSSELALWLPFWPFEPFIPLCVLGVGMWLRRGLTSSPRHLTPELA
ncbi:hypothetical protein N8723_04730 [Luminiphilus sp.]|nr:hypothetical protein [Luminiphilus sp.]NCF34704.1 hypothetical protein [Pseudomonadota bacterium]